MTCDNAICVAMVSDDTKMDMFCWARGFRSSGGEEMCWERGADEGVVLGGDDCCWGRGGRRCYERGGDAVKMGMGECCEWEGE